MTTDGPGPGPEEAPSLGAPRARAPWERKDPDDEVKHSALVGFMSVPVSRRLPIRRSTLLMVVAFAGLATLLYFNPPQLTAGSGVIIHTPQGDVFVPNGTPVSTTTTTTTVLPAPTTTVPPTTTTTTTSPSRSSTTASSTSTTSTTVRGGGSGGSGGGSTSTTTSTTSPTGSTSGSSGSGFGGTGTGTGTSSTTR